MTSRDFCFWLQGKLEIDGQPQALSAKQVEIIQKHLALVFVHEIDPSMGDEQHQKLLDKIHEVGEHVEEVASRPPGLPDYVTTLYRC